MKTTAAHPGSSNNRFGRYEIQEELGRGGMGVVYKAFDPQTSRSIAIKIMLGEASRNKDSVQRFSREIAATAKLRHPNIVSLYDAGEIDNRHYFTMDFVEGSPLSSLIKKKQFPVKKALNMFEQIADGISYSHSQGVIHRDLKPSNIMIDKRGNPIIMDFGLAKSTRNQTRMTRTGTIMGTVAYMPPEQANGAIRKIDERSDVYSLGAMLYEVLAGQTPFRGSSAAEVITQIFKKNPLKPSHFNRKIPQDVEVIILKALEKSRERRYQSAREMKDDIRRFIEGKSIIAKPRPWWITLYLNLERNKTILIINASVLAFLFIGFYLSQIKISASQFPPKSKTEVSSTENSSLIKKTPPIDQAIDETKEVVFPVGTWASFKWQENQPLLENMQVIGNQALASHPDFKCLAFNQGSRLHLGFTLPHVPPRAFLRFNHLTAAVGGKQGYSPITILINGKVFKEKYSVGDMGFVEEEFPLESFLIQGRNDIAIAMDFSAQSQYWIRRLEIIIGP